MSTQGLNILVSGGTGFLGTVICDTLRPHHKITRLGRSSGNEIICDLSISCPPLPQFDIVVHASGKAHVMHPGRKEEEAFFAVNATGTKNLVLALAQNPPRTIVLVSSVSVYGLHSGRDIVESAPLAATDAYGRSKIEAERLVTEFGAQYQVPVVILRLPLVFGPHPPGNLGALIRAIQKGYYVRIGPGTARRSVVRAADVAQLLPALAGRQGIFNLTDGIHPSVSDIDSFIAEKFNRRFVTIPEGVARVLARTGDFFPLVPLNSRRWEKLTSSLTFSDTRARKELGWAPSPFSTEGFLS